MKLLDIATINNEVELLHPSTHEFWEEEKNSTQFLEFLAVWSDKPAAYFKKSFEEQNKSNKNEKANEEEEVEMGFVDGLFEMYKLREGIAKS